MISTNSQDSSTSPEEAYQLLRVLLLRRDLKLCIAESLTGGNLQALVTAIPGISDVFEAGITAYKEDQKVHHLGVDREHARATNCVSERVAIEMARGACTLFGCSIGISTTGYAQPDIARGVTQPFAYWAIFATHLGVVKTQQGRVSGDGLTRVGMQLKVSREALDALISFLSDAPQDSY